MIRCPQDSRVAGRQLFEYLRKAGVGAVKHFGGARDEINSGGNIEAVPPHTMNGKSWPAGRTRDFILLDTDWLGIGHVDEFLQFFPADNERGWIVMADNPEAVIKLLQGPKDKGHGGIPSVSRKNDTGVPDGCNNSWFCDPIPVTPRSVEALLADKDLMDVNHRCAERISGNIEILKKEVGLEDKHFVRVPTLFENSGFGGGDAAALKVGALFPGVVNNLVLSGFKTCVAPKPWGPVVDGRDVLGEAIRAEYTKLGLNLTWIDDWNTHHNFGGEVHCGTNTIRDTSPVWW